VWNFVSHIKGEEHKLRVFENKVLMRIFGTRMEEVTGDWRKLHNLHSSADIIRMIKSRRMKCMGSSLLENDELWMQDFG
jgi:hypothetical protein